MQRSFRAGHIVRGVGATWLVDESWPVALPLFGSDPGTLLSWPWPDDSPGSDEGSVVLDDGVGLVIGVGGQVIWVRHDGRVVVDVEGRVTLAAVDRDTAWLVDRSAVNPGKPPAPPPALSPGRIVALRRDGCSRLVTTHAPVLAIGLRGGDVWVRLADLPLARPGLRQGSWWFSYPSSVVRVSRDELFTGTLAGAVPEDGDHFPHSVAKSRSGWRWLEEKSGGRDGLPAGGLRWDIGAPTSGDRINRHVVAVGHDAVGDHRSTRVDLGPGVVQDAEPVGDELWLAIARRRHLAVAHDRGVDVVALSACGEVRTVHRADSLDISEFAPPLRRAPQERIDAHIDTVLDGFAELTRYWHDPLGETSPLSDGLSDSSVRIEGQWPDTRVAVMFRHPVRPGLTLRRTLSLFDESGSPIEHEYAAIHLMEDLDTGYVAPADEAVDGVLDT